jgi:hypothetical protein
MNTIRHDAITLHSETNVDEFIKFVNDELIPYFTDRYKGPTRSSRADIKHQTVLQDAENPRKFVWVTAWDGSAESVSGSSFERARMSTVAETETLLKKIDTFGKRSAEKVFNEEISVEVGPNR